MTWTVAYMTALAACVVVANILCLIYGSLNKTIALVSMLVGIVVLFFVIIRYPKFSSGFIKKDFNFWSLFTIFMFGVFTWKNFFWLVFKKSNSLMIFSPHNMGDLALHITYIKNIANGILFWPDNPILTGTKLHYPIGMDIFNALLLLSGVDLIRGLVWIGLLSSIVTIFALLNWGGAFTLAGYLFNGGLAGFLFFGTLKLVNYQSDLAWKSLPLTLFVTQRGYLYALPVGLLLLSSWRNRFFSSENSELKDKSFLLPFWIEVLLYSSMPLFHMHTFVYFSLLLGFWLLFTKDKTSSMILKLVLLSLIPATLYIAYLTSFFKGFSAVHIHWGWVQGKESFLKFWLGNFGMFIPLVLYLLYKIFNKNDFKKPMYFPQLNSTTAFVYSSIILFVLFCIVMMNPWEWDNIKLLMWSYLILLPYIWKVLLSHQNQIVKYAICFLLFFSGFIFIIESMDRNYTGYDLFNWTEVNGVETAIKYLPHKYRFASYPTYNHPLLYAGRKVILGFPGHIWSHGFSYTEVEAKLKRVMLGDVEWLKLAKELDIKYIFWGQREENEYQNSLKPWEKYSKKIASGEWGAIYDLGDDH